LFGYILPLFKARSGIDVKVVAQGTGQALDAGRRGDAELGQEFIDWLISPIDWLISPEGQKAIAVYRINGEQLFYPNANNPSA
jgi:ABC-type tungstate transport system permease subunit